MKSILCIISLGMLFSCTKVIDVVSKTSNDKNRVDEQGFTRYLIKKGGHYSEGNGVKKITRRSLFFQARFDSTVIYTSRINSNQLDINKLYGLSDCSDNHQVNSARFGWRWNNSQVEILAYCYVNSERRSKLLGSVKIGEAVNMGISTNKNHYVFHFAGKVVEMDRSCDTDEITGFQLYPYFGGDETAPHDVSIYIREVEK